MRTLFRAGLCCLALSSCDSGIAVHRPDASGPFLGAVQLTSSPSTFSVQANFTTAQFAATGACPGTVMGNCCVYTQPQLVIKEGDAEPSTFSAGTIAVSDGAAALGSFAFTGYGYRPLSSAENQSLQWTPGDVLNVSASGGVADGFSATIAAPAAFASVDPALSPLEVTVVKLADDFTVRWTPGESASPVTLDLFDVNGFYVDCTAPDSAGSVTVPVESFGNFTANDNGIVTLSRSVSSTVQAGNDTVTLSAVATAVGSITFLP